MNHIVPTANRQRPCPRFSSYAVVTDGTAGPQILLAVLLSLAIFAASSAMASPANRTICAPVLIYHHVKPLKPTDDAIERGLTVVPSVFRSQLSYLASHHFHTVTAARLVSAIRGAAPLPARPIVLTFDDGYTDVYANVYELLRARRMTATFFIVPGFLDKPRYLTWRQVEDMSKHGMDIEAHTMTHPDLTTIGTIKLWSELRQSRAILQKRLHRQVRIMAYPYGSYSPAVLQAVAQSGYVSAFTTSYGECAATNSLLTLPRIYANMQSAQPVSNR